MTRQPADWRWKKRVARTRKKLETHPELAVCWLCGNPIDMDLPPGHKAAFTLDHIVPIARGGDLHSEARPAHRACNSARGNIYKPKETKTIIDW
nr:MAG TPA: HNH endonuclease [Caudoviricetes sp.]